MSFGRFVYSTDDAYVRTDLAIVAPKISGYVESVLADGAARARVVAEETMRKVRAAVGLNVIRKDHP